jgi:hypothetical protein
MTRQRIVSALVLIGGMVLLYIGMRLSDSMADSSGNTFFGRFAYATTWCILGGLAVGALGLYLLVTNLFGNRVQAPQVRRSRRA